MVLSHVGVRGSPERLPRVRLSGLDLPEGRELFAWRVRLSVSSSGAAAVAGGT